MPVPEVKGFSAYLNGNTNLDNVYPYRSQVLQPY